MKIVIKNEKIIDINDNEYKTLFLSCERINKLWNAARPESGKILIPGYNKNINSNQKIGLIFETISLNEIKKFYKNENLKVTYIGKRTSVQGFDLILIIDEILWICECKYRSISINNALEESMTEISSGNEFSGERALEIDKIIDYFENININALEEMELTEKSCEEIVKTISSYNNWSDVKNFISSIGSKNKTKLKNIEIPGEGNINIFVHFLELPNQKVNDIFKTLERKNNE